MADHSLIGAHMDFADRLNDLLLEVEEDPKDFNQDIDKLQKGADVDDAERLTDDPKKKKALRDLKQKRKKTGDPELIQTFITGEVPKEETEIVIGNRRSLRESLSRSEDFNQNLERVLNNLEVYRPQDYQG